MRRAIEIVLNAPAHTASDSDAGAGVHGVGRLAVGCLYGHAAERNQIRGLASIQRQIENLLGGNNRRTHAGSTRLELARRGLNYYPIGNLPYAQTDRNFG